MNEVQEPNISWGGSWTEKKLEAFEQYVNAYLTIMNAQKKKYNGWPTTIYFDGFAGSGKRTKENKESDDLFSDYFAGNENKLYKGSAERVLSLKQKFDYYFFIDNNKKSIAELEKRMRGKKLVVDKCFFIWDDVNKRLAKLSNFLNNKKAALVLLDPFGMQIDWASIEKLKDNRVDLWILIPSGVIINRFLDKKGKLKFSNKLQSYFGMSEDEIKNIFYKIETQETLFGSIDVTIKIEDSINTIAEIYIQKLKKIFKFVSETPLKLLNTKNVPIYHFVFAANKETALKIAKDIIEKKNK